MKHVSHLQTPSSCLQCTLRDASRQGALLKKKAPRWYHFRYPSYLFPPNKICMQLRRLELDILVQYPSLEYVNLLGGVPNYLTPG